jgi:hypothetical protein
MRLLPSLYGKNYSYHLCNELLLSQIHDTAVDKEDSDQAGSRPSKSYDAAPTPPFDHLVLTGSVHGIRIRMETEEEITIVQQRILQCLHDD